jgi:hypothetical protein
MNVAVLIKQTHGELVQFLAFVVHNLEKFPSILEPHAPEDAETARSGELAEDRMRQCGVEVLERLRGFKVFFSAKFWNTFREVDQLSGMSIFWVVKEGAGLVFVCTE